MSIGEICILYLSEASHDPRTFSVVLVIEVCQGLWAARTNIKNGIKKEIKDWKQLKVLKYNFKKLMHFIGNLTN